MIGCRVSEADDNTAMKIATWNVNSILARLERLRAWLQKVQPDIVCLQELKAR